MSRYTFFYNPQSRAAIAKWAFGEVGVEPEIVPVEWTEKPQSLLDANPMGKIPTIVHHDGDHDHVVTEAAAICHYLAEMEKPDLLPGAHEKAAYFRWLFFASGPLEAAITARSMGWSVDDPQKQGMLGYGSYDFAVDALDDMLGGRDYVCGERFTMADVYVGSQVGWGLAFGTLPDRDSFESYAARLGDRPAYKAAMGAMEG